MDKLGLFICTGCDIGKTGNLDLDKVKDIIEDDDNLQASAAVWETHERLCSEEGLKLVRDAIAEKGLEAVAIAACSPRVLQKELTFGETIVERINVRELGAWSFTHDPDEEVDDDNGSDASMLFADAIRIGLTRLHQTKPLEPYKADGFSKRILVVGGGITGMTAALDVTEAGYEAVLVEKDANLGGIVGKLYKQFPTAMPFDELQANTVPGLVKAIGKAKGITVHTGATIQKVTGGPGLFDVTIDSHGEPTTTRVGAIILATGAVPYDASKLETLGYGKAKDVITSMQLEEMAAAGKIARPSDGKQPKSVAFVQCAGSRDQSHLPYCSAHCCMTSLKQAHYLRETDKDARAYIIYKDMRTPGLFEEFYRHAQDDEGVFLTKGDVTSVTQKNGKVIVAADNTLLGEKIELEADLVVLATGLVPSTNTGTKEFDNTLTVAAPVVTEEKKGEEKKPSPRPPATVLHLEYRQGPELPNLEYGFPDSHFICFPYETRRTGIYAAGTVRQPMDSGKCAEDAAGAALKAIQCIEATIRGVALHPRSGDASYPEFFMQRCTQCKRCTEECPFGAINEDEKANPLPNPTRCRRCGTCMGACPERIISFKNYGVGMIGSMIKSCGVPEVFDEDDYKARIICLACENDAYPALDMAGMARKKLHPFVRFIPLRCMGSVNLVWIADALSRGIDGILMLGCKHGEDYQCHFVKGSELCSIRLSKVQETLQRLALESERIRFEQVQISDFHKLPDLINEFAKQVSAMAPNPYKG
jgi:quinone-modifying oxidoreductase subunit QmoB